MDRAQESTDGQLKYWAGFAAPQTWYRQGLRRRENESKKGFRLALGLAGGGGGGRRRAKHVIISLIMAN